MISKNSITKVYKFNHREFSNSNHKTEALVHNRCNRDWGVPNRIKIQMKMTNSFKFYSDYITINPIESLWSYHHFLDQIIRKKYIEYGIIKYNFFFMTQTFYGCASITDS